MNKDKGFWVNNWGLIVIAVILAIIAFAYWRGSTGPNSSDINTPQQGCTVEDTGGGTAC